MVVLIFLLCLVAEKRNLRNKEQGARNNEQGIGDKENSLYSFVCG